MLHGKSLTTCRYLSQIFLWLALLVLASSLLWFFLHPANGMAQGFARIFGALYLLLGAGLCLTLSVVARFLLIKSSAAYKTQRQYMLLGFTGVPALAYVLSLLVYFLILAYEKLRVWWLAVNAV